MYAITSTSFRAITDASWAHAGEAVVDALPASLLAVLESSEQRLRRDAMLASCDWTQIPDSPLDAAHKSAWSFYRQGLRDVPAQAGFPATIQWPISP